MFGIKYKTPTKDLGNLYIQGEGLEQIKPSVIPVSQEVTLLEFNYIN